MVRLDLRRVIANRDFQVASALRIDGGDRRLRSDFGLRAKVELHAGEQADGGGPEKLYTRPAKRYTIGFQGEIGEIAVDGVGGDCDFVVDLVGRFRCGSRCIAFRQPQAGACGDLGRRVHGGNRVLAPDHQAMKVVEKGRGVRRFDGDADAHAVALLCSGGNFEACAHVRLVPIEFRRLTRGQEGTGGPARQLQNDFAGFGSGELHGEDAVLELNGEQLGGGVDNVLRGGEIGAIAAQAIGTQGNAYRKPQGLSRPHAHAGNQQRPS